MKEKHLNFVCNFITILFALYVILYMIFAAVSAKQNEQKFIELNNWVAAINKKAEEENLIFKDENNNVENVEPLFTDGKTALITAYNNTMGANSMVATVIGELHLNLPAGTYGKIKMLTEVVKFNENKNEELDCSYVIDATKLILGTLIANAQKATKVSVDGEQKLAMFQTDPNKVKLVNDMPTADFTGKTFEPTDKLSILENVYIINENTIEEITYFKIKYLKGVPYQYYVQAKLNPVTAVTNYSNYIFNSMPSGSVLHGFSNVQLTVIIDNKGNISAITSRDEFQFESMGFSCSAVNEQNYAISCVGEEIKER